MVEPLDAAGAPVVVVAGALAVVGDDEQAARPRAASNNRGMIERGRTGRESKASAAPPGVTPAPVGHDLEMAGRRKPRPPALAGLLLTPGAGADRTQSALVAVDDAVSAGGLAVRRVDFPYRRAGRRAPDRAPVLVATVVEETQALASELAVATDHLAIGGRSMGGRMCSMAVAEGLAVGALVLISYPLHPPGRPEKLRTDHLGALTVPCLFVSGTRDAFGTPTELDRATAAIPGPVTTVWIEGGDHGLRGKDGAVAEAVAQWLSGLA